MPMHRKRTRLRWMGLAAAVCLTATQAADAMNPTAEDDNGVTWSDTPVTVNVLANDTGHDGPLNPSTVTILSGPSSGSASIDPDTGEITYTPVVGVATIVQIEYGVCDIYGAPSNPAWVNIQVMHDAPYTEDDLAVTSYVASKEVAVLMNDWQGTVAINPSSVTITTQPEHGSVSVNSTTGVVTYTPDGDYAGGDAFEYTVADTAGAVSNVSTVSLYLDNVTPEITNFQATYAGHGYWNFSGTVVDERPGNQPVKLISSLFSGGEVTATTNDVGVFNRAVNLGYGMVQGTVFAKMTDELGLQSPSAVTGVYGYGY